MGPAEPSRIAKIILLHGTWGRGIFRREKMLVGSAADVEGKRWFDRGSSFRTGLEANLPDLPTGSSIRWFAWSGANSVFERDVAAKKLAEELRADLEDPRAVPVIVAHSHGGNVALRALSQIEGADRVKVVTMATPFLRVFARDSFNVSLFVWWLMYATLVGVIVALIMLPLAFMLDAYGNLESRFGAVFAAVGVLSLVAAAFVMRAISGFINPGAPPGSDQPSHARRIQQAAEYRAVDAAGPSLLVIRGVDDEAALSLAAGSIGSGLTRWLVFVALPGVLTPLTLVWMVFGSRVDSFMPFVFAGVGFIGLVFLFVAALCKAAFGREFVRAAFVCEIAADSTPDASAQIESITLSPVVARTGLRHSIYEHPDCAKRVASWIREAVTVRSEDLKRSA